MNILVVGGAGYIGSHMLLKLKQAGHEVIVLDDLSTGHQESVLAGTFIQGSLQDQALLTEIFTANALDAVMHFSAFIQVGESVQLPAKYYHNNVVNTLRLLDTMLAHQVNKFIFSSTAAIFGNPEYTPIDSSHPKNPINPYGRSKWFIEQILSDYDHAYGLKSVALRYFNAAGADPLTRIGEWHETESHLIPLLLQVASKHRSHIDVFGNDYPTRDGTCIRDYIHIMDLCSAHLLALAHLAAGKPSCAYNLGNGQGFSVQEVIAAAQVVTGQEIPIRMRPRRRGDPPILVADARAAARELGWQPQYPDIHTIIEHAWAWEQKLHKLR